MNITWTYLLDTLFYSLIILTAYLIFRLIRKWILSKRKVYAGFRLQQWIEESRDVYLMHGVLGSAGAINIETLDAAYQPVKTIYTKPDHPVGPCSIRLNLSEVGDEVIYIRIRALDSTITRRIRF